MVHSHPLLAGPLLWQRAILHQSQIQFGPAHNR